MGRVRPLEPADVPAVASLFQRIFRRSPDPAPAALTAYLRELYLDGPCCADDIPALVHVGNDALISGFIGRHVLPMRISGRSVRMAMLSSIMADERAGDPLAGAKLLKAALTGPQDCSFSETASDVSMAMWKRIGGIALPGYSLDWLRVIRPAALAVETFSSRRRWISIFSPAASAVDGRLRRRMSPARPRWQGLSEERGTRHSLHPIGADEFAALLLQFVERFAFRPEWTADALSALVTRAMDKPEHGEPVLAAVEGADRKRIGVVLYHVAPGRTARVVQLLSLRGFEQSVLDALIYDAAEHGASAIRGRSQPFLLEATLGRRIGLLNNGSTVVHSLNAEILHAVSSGDAFVNGLAGEQWSRLIGGRFG